MTRFRQHKFPEYALNDRQIICRAADNVTGTACAPYSELKNWNAPLVEPGFLSFPTSHTHLFFEQIINPRMGLDHDPDTECICSKSS